MQQINAVCANLLGFFFVILKQEKFICKYLVDKLVNKLQLQENDCIYHL